MTEEQEKKANTQNKLLCPHCGKIVSPYRNPKLTVDIVIRVLNHQKHDNFLLIERINPPHGWALPGGFVDYGETVEHAAIREAKEETCLDVELNDIIGVYSDPARDPRHHTVTIAYAATAEGTPIARDDAGAVQIFTQKTLPARLAFDHAKILNDYFNSLK